MSLRAWMFPVQYKILVYGLFLINQSLSYTYYVTYVPTGYIMVNTRVSGILLVGTSIQYCVFVVMLFFSIY